MYSYEQIFANKMNILFVTAHPDDILVFFAALISKLVSDKKQIYVVTVTNGARGSRDNKISEETLAKERVQEELAALQYLGVPNDHCVCLNYKDGEVESDFKLIGQICKYIRKYKVDLVATHEPTIQYTTTYDKSGFFVQHRDHRKVGEAVIDCCYPFSRDRSFFPELEKEGIQPHTVKDILLTDEAGANFDFDYTGSVEVKKKALTLHKSQFDEQTAIEFIEAVKFDGTYFEKFRYVNVLW